MALLAVVEEPGSLLELLLYVMVLHIMVHLIELLLLGKTFVGLRRHHVSRRLLQLCLAISSFFYSSLDLVLNPNEPLGSDNDTLLPFMNVKENGILEGRSLLAMALEMKVFDNCNYHLYFHHFMPILLHI